MEQTFSDLERLLAKELAGSRALPVVDGVIVPASAEGFYRLAEWYVKAGTVPDSLRGGNGVETTAKVAIAISAGASVGLSHTQSMANVMVVNNRPSMWGDALIAVVRGSPECVSIVDTLENLGPDGHVTDRTVAVCDSTRIRKLVDGTYERETVSHRFSVGDAKTAGLWGKAGPWSKHPKRMLQSKPRAYTLRDLWADRLMGIGIVEEQQDIEDERRSERVGHAAEAARTASASLGAAAPDAPQTPATAKPVPEGGIGLPRKTKDDTTAHGPGDAPRTVAGEGNTTPANPDPSAAAGNGAKAGGQTTTPTGSAGEPTDADLAASLGKDLFAGKQDRKR